MQRRRHNVIYMVKYEFYSKYLYILKVYYHYTIKDKLR